MNVSTASRLTRTSSAGIRNTAIPCVPATDPAARRDHHSPDGPAHRPRPPASPRRSRNPAHTARPDAGGGTSVRPGRADAGRPTGALPAGSGRGASHVRALWNCPASTPLHRFAVPLPISWGGDRSSTPPSPPRFAGRGTARSVVEGLPTANSLSAILTTLVHAEPFQRLAGRQPHSTCHARKPCDPVAAPSPGACLGRISDDSYYSDGLFPPAV